LVLKRFAWLLIPAAAACAGSAPRWEKPGADQAALDEAIGECRVQARLASLPSGPRSASGTSTSRILTQQEELAEVADFGRCMRGKGFREIR
jgi:hypothetical protein